MVLSGGQIKIIKTLAPNLHHFGDYLNSDSNGRHFEIIKEMHKDECESGCRAMFQMWSQGKGTEPFTWWNLARLLEKFGEKKLAAGTRTLKL